MGYHKKQEDCEGQDCCEGQEGPEVQNCSERQMDSEGPVACVGIPEEHPVTEEEEAWCSDMGLWDQIDQASKNKALI